MDDRLKRLEYFTNQLESKKTEVERMDFIFTFSWYKTDWLEGIKTELRTTEIDKIYEKICENRSYYDFFVDGYRKPYNDFGCSDIFETMCDWDESDSKLLKLRYDWLSTKAEVRNCCEIFGYIFNNICDENTFSIFAQCLKIIDLKQFILTLLFKTDIKDYTFDNLLKEYELICPNVFHFEGFTKKEWNDFIKNKTNYNVRDFINIFNNSIYKLYTNIENTLKPTNGFFKTYDKNGRIEETNYKLENVLYVAHRLTGVAPTFMPQSFEWFDVLSNECQTIYKN